MEALRVNHVKSSAEFDEWLANFIKLVDLRYVFDFMAKIHI